MSLLPFDIVSGIAIGMLSTTLSVRDIQYDTVRGVDIEVPTGTRSFEAAVEVGARTLEPIFGESVSDGDLGIWPEDGSVELHYPDEFQSPAYTQQDVRRQSFIMYHGVEYRVVSVSDFTDQAGRKVYLAKRHVRQDLPQ